jgi:hypothetical protein
MGRGSGWMPGVDSTTEMAIRDVMLSNEFSIRGNCRRLRNDRYVDVAMLNNLTYTTVIHPKLHPKNRKIESLQRTRRSLRERIRSKTMIQVT